MATSTRKPAQRIGFRSELRGKPQKQRDAVLNIAAREEREYGAERFEVRGMTYCGPGSGGDQRAVLLNVWTPDHYYSHVIYPNGTSR